jgi:hypothetical protein
MLFVIDEHQVLAFKDEERFRRVTMTMERWPEARGLTLGLQHRELARRLVTGGENNSLKVP